MPGLYGIASPEGDSARTARARRAFDAVVDAGRFRRESLEDPEGHWTIGRQHLGVLQPAPQLAGDRSVQVLFHGDLDNRADLSADPRTGLGDAELLGELYARSGLTGISRLRGAFCAAILDTASRQLHLVADRIGSYPLYWADTAQGFVFSSGLRGLLQTGLVPRALDADAVGDYLAYGFPMGTKTLAAGVSLVAPGSIVTYRWTDGVRSTTRYDDFVTRFEAWTGTREDYLDALGSAFESSVTRALAGTHAFGLSLSGGMDSRAVLSALNGQAQSLTTYTLGVDGCADQVIADRLASLAGTRHHFFRLDDRYLSEFLPNMARMVSFTDGMYLSHGLTEMLALDFLGATNIEVLLRGHGGELAKTGLAWPFHTDPAVTAMRSSDELVPYLLARINYIGRGIDVSGLFTPAWAEPIASAARRSLERAVADVALTPADLCSYLYLFEHHRRSTTASLDLFRQHVEVRLPFVDIDFLSVLFRAPAEWRAGLDIHRALIARHGRKLLHVRNSNTGAPGDAGPAAEFLLDKVNGVLKRLNVRGFRHYHDFDDWMKQQLLDSVEAVLLDRTSLERGLLRESGLRALLDETRRGTADRAYLLQVLLIIELWQRENL